MFKNKRSEVDFMKSVSGHFDDEVALLEMPISQGLLDDFCRKVGKIPEDKRRVALATHKKPDPDALATAMAVQLCLKVKYQIESDIFSVGSPSHPQNKTMINRLQINLKDDVFWEKNREHYGLIVFCDTGKENASLKVDPDIIIDHHIEKEIFSKECLVIRSVTGAASSIAYLLLKELGVIVTSRLATALLVGINADTKDLTKKPEVTEIDIAVHKELRPLVDWPLFSYISSRYETTKSWISGKGKAFANVVYENGGLALVGVGAVSKGQDSLLSVVADEVFSVQEVRMVVVIAIEDGEEIVAKVRTDLDSISINDFCAKVFEAGSETDKGKASAGARVGSGGANIPLSTREREEWALADAKEKELLFDIRMRRYRRRILEFLEY